MRHLPRPAYPASYTALLTLMALIMPDLSGAQESATQPGREQIIRAARVLDVRAGTYIKGAAIWVEGERIKALGPESDLVKQAPSSAELLDLGDVTLLPGLIDCHSHLMARQVSSLPSAGSRGECTRNARRDITLLQHVEFVMKGAAVIKNDLVRAH